MPHLGSVGRRFENELYTTAGYPFYGTVEPLDEGAIASYDFSEPRLVLRVRTDCPITAPNVIMDTAGRKFVMGDHDTGLAFNTTLYRTHRLYHCNQTVEWRRETPGATDALTGLKRSTGSTLMGVIDVMIEVYGREQADVQLRLAEERTRLVTASPIRLGDIVGDKTVRRLDQSLGIWLAELE